MRVEQLAVRAPRRSPTRRCARPVRWWRYGAGSAPAPRRRGPAPRGVRCARHRPRAPVARPRRGSRPSCSLAAEARDLQHLDERLGAGRGRLPGRAVGAVRGFEELGGARADLVGEPVQLGEGRALVALRAGLLGPQVGADAHLLVQLGGGAVGLAQGGQRGARSVRVRRGDGLRRTGDLGALGTQGAGGAAGVVAGALGGPAVLVGGAGPLQASGRPRLGLGRVVGQFAECRLPAGPLAEPERETGQDVGDPAGALGRLLPFVADTGRVGGGLVRLGPRRTGLGERRLGRLGALPGRRGRRGQFHEHAGRAVGPPRTDPGGERAVPGEPGRAHPDLFVAGGRAGTQRLPLLVGGVFVVHGRVRRYEEHPVVVRAARAGPGTGASRAAAVPTATVERGSRAAPARASRARACEAGSVITTPSTSSGRAASTAAWSAGSTAWAR